jgi:hypothetical protein
MGYWRQFDDFDPKKGLAPHSPFRDLQGVVNRAQKILSHRTADEIYAAAQLIDWIIEDFFENDINRFIQAQIQDHGWARPYLLDAMERGENILIFAAEELSEFAGQHDSLDFYCDIHTSQVEALKKCIDMYDIVDEDFRDATQGECFAVLALWLIADCIRWLERPTGAGVSPELYTTSANYSLAANASMEAMDAVSHAELLQQLHKSEARIQDIKLKFEQEIADTEEKNERKLAQRRSEQARMAAAKRHEENSSIKQDAITHYELHKHQYKSNEDAARHIAEIIVPVKHRTVVKWISDHLKR